MASAAQQAIRLAALDPAASAARKAAASALTTRFVEVGMRVRVHGYFIGPERVDGTSPFGNAHDGVVALGYVGETAGRLVSGVADLVTVNNAYAAAALCRQLVEVEYLLWAFAEDREEAADWLRSDKQQRLARWQPRHLRERSAGRFKGADYAQHCELGGHPTPSGLRGLLPPGDDARVLCELIMSEALIHGSSAWQYFLRAPEADDLADHEGSAPVQAALAEWRRVDEAQRTWQDITAARSADL